MSDSLHCQRWAASARVNWLNAHVIVNNNNAQSIDAHRWVINELNNFFLHDCVNACNQHTNAHTCRLRSRPTIRTGTQRWHDAPIMHAYATPTNAIKVARANKSQETEKRSPVILCMLTEHAFGIPDCTQLQLPTPRQSQNRMKSFRSCRYATDRSPQTLYWYAAHLT